MLQTLLLLEMVSFPQILIQFWVNVYIFWEFWQRNFYWYRLGSVDWIRIERNVFAYLLHHSSVNWFNTRGTYWLHRGCKVGYIYDFCWYFWGQWNFWVVCWLSNQLIDRWFLSALILFLLVLLLVSPVVFP